MLLLTNETGEKAIQCDFFADTIELKPHHLVTITDEDGTRWYVLGEAIQRENDWLVPLAVVAEDEEAEARRTGTIKTFHVTGDGALA
jgi:hypothetical protein